MKAKIYIGAKKYALYIGRKIVQKTLEFLTIPARFVSKKVQDLKNYLIYGDSKQDGTPTPTDPIEVESVGIRTNNLISNNFLRENIIADTGAIVPVAWGVISCDYSKVKPSTRYYFTKNSTINFKMRWFDKDKNYIGYSPALGSSVGTIITSPSNAYYFRIVVDTDDINIFINENAQIEEGLTPTPYEPYGYKIPVTVGGKNLFDKSNFKVTNLYQTAVTTVGITQPLVGADTLLGFIFDVRKINGNITISRSVSGGAFRVFGTTEYPASGVMATSLAIENNKLTMTCDVTNYNYLSVICVTGSEGVLINILQGVQLELGSTATEYQPYITPTTTNIYLDQPLRKIGEYADYIDFENQKVVRNIGVLGTEELASVFQIRGVASSSYVGSQFVQLFSTSSTQQVLTKYNFGGSYASRNHRFNVLCTKLVPLNEDFSQSTYKYGMIGVDSSLNMFIGTTKPVYSSEMAQRIRDLNLELVLPLNTPTEETIDLPVINLPQGTVTMNTDTNVKPSKIILTGDIDNE